jgi:hypothetical protein
MSRVIYKIDEWGGAYDFNEIEPIHEATYVKPDRTGDTETDLWEVEGPLTPELAWSCHLPKFYKHYAKTQMKQRRNSKLVDSDYLMLQGAAVWPPDPAWIAFRQALRDVPANNPDPDLDEDFNLIGVDWPEQPPYPGNSGPL